MVIPRLSVADEVAARIITALIGEGEMILSNYALEPHNSLIALQHQVNLGRWSQAAEDRVNALFEQSVFRPGDLLTNGGNNLQLGRLKDLLAKIEPPKVAVFPESIARGQQIMKEVQAKMDPLNIERFELHPKIMERCKGPYNAAHPDYDNVVVNAFKVVELELKSLSNTKPDLHGVPLIGFILNPSKPLLKLGTDKGELESAHHFFSGAFGLFRNPSAHKFVVNDRLRAFELLVLASLLMKMIDEAKKTVVDDSGLPPQHP